MNYKRTIVTGALLTVVVIGALAFKSHKRTSIWCRVAGAGTTCNILTPNFELVNDPGPAVLRGICSDVAGSVCNNLRWAQPTGNP